MMNKLLTRNRINIIKDQILKPGGFLVHMALRICKWLGLQRVPCLPDTLDIEPNNDCNFKCNHCQVTHWHKKRAHMGIEQFKELIRQFPNLTRIKLQGMGEPFLNKNMLPMLEYGDQKGISMRFISNGSIVTQALAEKLAKMNKLGMSFSMDGASKEVFESIRIGGRFEKVCNNIKKITQARGEQPRPLISLTTVITKNNHETLADMVDLAHELGIATLGFQLSLTDWGSETMAQHTEALRIDGQSLAVARSIEEANRRAERLGVELILHNSSSFSRSNPCPWPWESAFIAANGDVVPCCVIANSDVAKMGNVFETPFKKIWNSEAYRDLRKKIAGNQPPHYCHGCYGLETKEPEPSALE